MLVETGQENPANNTFQTQPISPSFEEMQARRKDIHQWVENTFPLNNCENILDNNNSILSYANSADNSKMLADIVAHKGEVSGVNNMCAIKEKNVEDSSNNQRRSWENKIPPVFKKMRLCVLHFHDNLRCYKPNCVFSHSLCSVQCDAIACLNMPKLKEAYKWTLSFRTVFAFTFQAFCRRFSELKRQEELLEMVNDALKLDLFDRTPYVDQVIWALQEMGHSFNAAVELLHCHNERNSDILLDVIIESSISLTENWALIQRILLSRTEKIDFGVVEDIIRRTLKSGSKNLCLQVYYDIFDRNLCDCRAINQSLLFDFLSCLYQHNLFAQYIELERKIKIGDTTIASTTSSTCSVRLSSTFSHDDNSNFLLPSTADVHSGSCCQPELRDCEIRDLLDTLKNNDIKKFIELIKKYQSCGKTDSFALNTVVYLKQNNLQVEYFNLLKKIGNAMTKKL